MIERIVAGTWLLASALLIYAGWGIHAPHSYEPIGPRAFPLLLLAVMGVCALPLLFQRKTAKTKFNPIVPGVASGAEPSTAESPDASTKSRLIKQGACIAALIVYALIFTTFGFVLATVLLVICQALLYGGKWRGSLILGITASVVLFIAFDMILDVPLPLGPLEPFYDFFDL